MTGNKTILNWRSPAGIIFLILLGVATFFIVIEYWARIAPVLPWLILLACPLMHLFMHGSHRSHDNNSKEGKNK